MARIAQPNNLKLSISLPGDKFTVSTRRSRTLKVNNAGVFDDAVHFLLYTSGPLSQESLLSTEQLYAHAGSISFMISDIGPEPLSKRRDSPA